ncbi:suppressor of fused domain protein [uncultured Oscillibacter sp.]|uniref:suppressor of fused domain protein n=1 Tax=uncultured Oscillibacter sp. TaxID=876091 RepID=UPI00262F3AE9|nr:suppressor of fused domain protein [uncultured Oscillibacter sp.]
MDPLDVFHETPKQSAGPSGGEEISAPGWDAITEAFQTLYPGQEHPLHFGVLIPWQLGGPNPLQGVSAYDGGDFFHLVTYGLTDLYEKEGTDPDYSGYGYEFTMKLRKAGLEDVHAELHCAAGILQDLAKLTFEKGEQFYPNEYIYTGQTTGMDVRQVSKLTGFITAWDEAGTIETPNGKVDFVQLIGATDPELRAVMDGTLRVAELAERLGGWTDYTRDSTV